MNYSNIFCYHKERGFLWFRLFGYGFVFKNHFMHRLTFSQRTGLAKGVCIGRWFITFEKRIQKQAKSREY